MYALSNDPESFGAARAAAQATSNFWYNGELNLWPAGDYGKANPDFSNFHQWGHFSQLIWKGTQQVGCASNYCPPGTMNPTMGAWFTVCNYFPAGLFPIYPSSVTLILTTGLIGNMDGAYGENVLPPRGDPTLAA